MKLLDIGDQLVRIEFVFKKISLACVELAEFDAARIWAQKYHDYELLSKGDDDPEYQSQSFSSISWKKKIDQWEKQYLSPLGYIKDTQNESQLNIPEVPAKREIKRKPRGKRNKKKNNNKEQAITV
ncbi:MAG: hypothetical protein EOP45_20265 [Sphingobacteriaceae bacterium]|nr:MAG: hypothetical protein EOP45_20265 [Sphingobacteriaceae bacterium]